MTASGYPNEPMELDVYSGDSGVLRTVYVWFPVSGFVAAGSALNFKLDASQEVAPSALGLKIVQKTAEIPATEDAWNRADSRKMVCEWPEMEHLLGTRKSRNGGDRWTSLSASCCGDCSRDSR
jgi:hypothetical protein